MIIEYEKYDILVPCDGRSYVKLHEPPILEIIPIPEIKPHGFVRVVYNEKDSKSMICESCEHEGDGEFWDEYNDEGNSLGVSDHTYCQEGHCMLCVESTDNKCDDYKAKVVTSERNDDLFMDRM